MNKRKIIAALTLAALLLPQTAAAGQPLTEGKEAQLIHQEAAYLLKSVPEPGVASIGGEWAIIGLARSGETLPQGYTDGYYKRLEARLKETKGVLHSRKYTEYARTALAVTAIGKDPRQVGGYNLLQPLADFDQTTWQGINGPVFALLALDAGEYPVPVCPDSQKQATRERYLAYILEHQLTDGGFALTGSQADADMTAMVLQALAKYQDQPRVKLAGKLAFGALSRMQTTDGGFASWGKNNAESTAQVLMALCEWGISPEDVRFIKNGRTVVDNLLSYHAAGGGFKHLASDGQPNAMASEQAFYALVNYERLAAGQASLYRMLLPTKEQAAAV